MGGTVFFRVKVFVIIIIIVVIVIILCLRIRLGCHCTSRITATLFFFGDAYFAFVCWGIEFG